jgi:hypothetical protein
MRKTTIESNTVTKRRLTWAELYRIRPDLKPANDNERLDEPQAHPTT